MPKSAKRKKKDSKRKNGGNLSRRSALKLGAAAGLVTVLTSKKSFAQQVTGCVTQPEPPTCFVDSTHHHSPATSPFARALPIPPVAQPVPALNPAPTKAADIAGGEAARADHQRWDEFLPHIFYDIHVMPGCHNFHPQLGDTYIWGYNGIVPGPTFHANYGAPILVRLHNELPAPHMGPGDNRHTTHLHNGHTASESDGFACDFWQPGLFKDHHYPNILAGFDTFPPEGDQREALYTLWYHEHRHTFTAPNNYRGLNGMFFLFNEIDTNNETDTSPTALRLPSGQFDVPMIFTDKMFCDNGQLAFDMAFGGGVPPGDKFIVNGAIQPFFQVQRRKYRFRILNTGPARIWDFTLVNGDNGTSWQPWTVIATDGNLLESPIQVPDLEVMVSSRYDVIIDFSQASLHQSIYMLNVDPMHVSNPEPPPVNGVDITRAVIRFDVVADPPTPDPSQVPAILTTYPPINLKDVITTRIWDFEQDPNSGVFTINGFIFNCGRADAVVGQGTAETWILHNKKTKQPSWTHPVHIHFEEGMVLARNNLTRAAGTLPPLETGRRDVYPIRNSTLVPGGEKVMLFIRFREFMGKYMIHCHNMGHEDNFMIARWDIGPVTGFTTSGVPNPDPPIVSADDPRYKAI
jgi:FtsP/CotA-like multicopper oxidase with cupredoxin domain